MDLTKLLRYGLAGWTPGGRYECILCGHRVWRFMPYKGGTRSAPPLTRTIDVVGSNLDAFECPRCGSHDRERHLYLYLEATGLLSDMTGRRVVHFAPEARLSRKIALTKPADYIQCDLSPSKPTVRRVDLMEMPFANASVDVLIANHVLEHVRDDIAALREIDRVLTPNGIAILQTPYSRLLQSTWEDAGLSSPEARLHAYGQEDHVRLYGRDIFERFTIGSLAPEIGTHEKLLPEMDAERFGVNPEEPLFLYRKQE